MIDLARCSLAYGDVPGRCGWCGATLPARRRRWCRDRCRIEYQVNHVWKFARHGALRRSGGRCVTCGVASSLEVNHRTPLAGRPRTESCDHHQANLEALCHDCHVAVTRRQRAAGWVRPDDV